MAGAEVVCKREREGSKGERNGWEGKIWKRSRDLGGKYIINCDWRQLAPTNSLHSSVRMMSYSEEFWLPPTKTLSAPNATG